MNHTHVLWVGIGCAIFTILSCLFLYWWACYAPIDRPWWKRGKR